MKNLLVAIFIIFSFNCFAQKDSGFVLYDAGWSTTMMKGKLKGITIDSGYNHLWYKSNYKNIPERGIFIDTLSYEDDYSIIKIIRIFYDRKLISHFYISYRNYEKPYFDYNIEKEYLLPKK